MEYHCQTWPTSLACRYCRATSDEGNYTVLANLIRTMEGADNTPPADAAVAHLRVGDVFVGYEAADLSLDEILNGPSVCARAVKTDAMHGGDLRHCYIMNLAYYEQQLRQLPERVRTIYLVAGSHYVEGFERSSAYIRRIRFFFVSRGYAVHLRLGGAPDDDIVFMSRASYFIQGGGGYSLMIAGIVRALGTGKVLNSPVTPSWCLGEGAWCPQVAMANAVEAVRAAAARVATAPES